MGVGLAWGEWPTRELSAASFQPMSSDCKAFQLPRNPALMSPVTPTAGS